MKQFVLQLVSQLCWTKSILTLYTKWSQKNTSYFIWLVLQHTFDKEQVLYHAGSVWKSKCRKAFIPFRKNSRKENCISNKLIQLVSQHLLTLRAPALEKRNCSFQMECELLSLRYLHFSTHNIIGKMNRLRERYFTKIMKNWDQQQCN